MIGKDEKGRPARKEFLAGEAGFEPALHAPEACVLPLDDSPTWSKRTRIGQQIQSPLSYH